MYRRRLIKSLLGPFALATSVATLASTGCATDTEPAHDGKLGTTAAPLLAPVQADFSDANGWNAPAYANSIRFADVNGDGNTDVCGRRPAGVYCALANTNSGFNAITQWSGLYTDAEGWAPLE